MVCNNCGQTCADGVRFCTNCGADLSAAASAVNYAANPAMQGMEAAPATKEKKPANRKMTGLVAILLIMMCVIALMNSKPDYVTMEKKSILKIEVVDDDVMVVYANGKADKLKYESCSDIQYSIDKTVACFVNEDKEVIVIRNGKEIKTGVEEVSNVLLSVYGDTFAYLEDVERNDETGAYEGALHLFYIKNKKDKKIDSDVKTGSVVLSPNGKTVAYVTDWEYEDDEEKFKGYYSVNGKEPKLIAKDAQTFVIADNAKYTYYMDGDRVYVKKKNKEGVKLSDNVTLNDFYVNEDCSELIYVVSSTKKSDVTTYMTVKGKEKVKISGNSVSDIILPSVALTKTISEWYGTFTGLENLKEHLYVEKGRIAYLTRKGEFETVVSECYDYALSYDMESLVYIDEDQDIYRVTKLDKDGGKKKKIASDTEASYLYAEDELKYVYFINEDNELYCVKGKKAKMIAEDVESFRVTPDGKACYYVVAEDEEEDVLFYVKKAGKGKEIVTAESVSLSNVRVCIRAEVSKDDEVSYNLLKGKKLKEVYSRETD